MIPSRDRVVAVTGASRGIGNAIAETFARYGFKIAMHYSTDDSRAQAVLERISDTSQNTARKYKAEFNTREYDLVDRIMDDFGRIDVLVNNAGVLGRQSFLSVTADEVEDLFSVNFYAPYFLARDAFREMKAAGGGRIINISSSAVRFGMGRNQTIHYAATKSALEAMTIGLARAGAEYNILVNAVRPGVIDTDLQRGRLDREERVKLIPLQRMGQPEEVADMVHYLASEKASFITGQVLSVSGGE